MQELEHNQKINAHWKTWAVLIFLFAMAITFLMATHRNLAGTGDQALNSIKQQIEIDDENWEKDRKKHEAEIKKLEEKIKDCKSNNNPEEKLEDCNIQKGFVIDEIETTNNKLLRCEQKLSAAKRNN